MTGTFNDRMPAADRNGTPCLAEPSDRENLSALWQLCFHDPEVYVRNFRQFMADDQNTVVIRENGAVVSAAYLLPAVFRSGTESCSAWYLYAACTHPDVRNRGYMSAIVQFCKHLAEQRKIDMIYLLPADGSLYKYYSKFGFRPYFSRRQVSLTRAELTEQANRLRTAGPGRFEDHLPEDGEDLFQIREEALHGSSYISWNRAALKYAFFEHKWSGGHAVILPGGYALYQQNGTSVQVKEICAHPDYAALLDQLAGLGAEQYEFHLPVGSPITGQKWEIRRSGMAVSVTETGKALLHGGKDAYIGFTLE